MVKDCRIRLQLQLVAVLALTICTTCVKGSTVGVCYGTNGNNLPSPSAVVSLLQSKNVDRVHIYDVSSDVLSAFQGSGISLIVSVPNTDLPTVAALASTGSTWVQNNIVPYSSVIKYISVGNEVLIGDASYNSYLYAAMQNVYSGLQAAGLSDSIKVSTTHAYSVVQGYPPSTGTFTSAVSSTMGQILSFLSSTGAPFFVNIYPYFTYVDGSVSLNYALFETGTTVSDNGYTYTNLFDAQMDTVVAALSAAGYSDMAIHVTESGWPSAGDSSGAASVDNAKTYNNNLVAHVPNGSPRRSGTIQTYIFALFNENLKSAGIEQHWGVYNADESMVYSLTF